MEISKLNKISLIQSNETLSKYIPLNTSFSLRARFSSDEEASRSIHCCIR